MQKRFIKYSQLLLFLLLFTSVIMAQPQKEIKSLNGYWSFSVGDDFSWRYLDHNFSDWDKIYVGQSWESQGYSGYNGYAWYKKSIQISRVDNHTNLFLKIDNIDDADEVYFNGTLIGKMGGFPPNVKTAYNQVRNYKIPAQLIHYNQGNIIAIRVYDFYLEGGILGHVGIYKDVASGYYLQDLTGEWEFAIGNGQYDYQWTKIKSWEAITVPGTWESQGYENYDGIAWYKKSFQWKDSDYKGNLVFVLGRIDDSDIVYLNGNQIGSIVQMKNSGKYDAGRQEYRTLRAYEVMETMLKQGQNTIVIRVQDTGIDGGIYEGPVGIMTKEAFQNYFRNYEDKKSLFDYLWENIFE